MADAPPSRRGRAARRAAQRDKAPMYAVTLRDYLEKRTSEPPHDEDSDDDETYQPLPSSSEAVAGPSTTTGSSEEVVRREIRSARAFVNEQYQRVIPQLQTSLPRSSGSAAKPPIPALTPGSSPRRAMTGSAKRRHVPVAAPPPTATPAREIRDLQRLAHEGFQNFRSSQRCATVILDEIDQSSRAGQSADTVRAVWDVLSTLVTSLGVDGDLWSRFTAVLEPALFNDEGELYRTVAAEQDETLRVRDATIARQNGMLPRLATFFGVSMEHNVRRRIAAAMRVWRSLAQEQKKRRQRLDIVLERHSDDKRLSGAFLKWRRTTAGARRREAANTAAIATNEARTAKASLTQAVTRGREDAVRELNRLQVQFQDEQALREAQFLSLSSEIQTLAADVAKANTASEKAIAERDLWRLCWEPVRDSFVRRSVGTFPGVLVADGKAVKLILENVFESTAMHRSMALAEMADTHRSVSQMTFMQADTLRDIAALQEATHDLLVHWANAELANFGAQRTVFSIDDLRDGEIISTLCDSISELFASHRELLPEPHSTASTGTPRSKFWQLCERFSHLPQQQPLVLACPYALDHLLDDSRFLEPAEAAWFYWVLATLLVVRCSLWNSEALEEPSDLHLIRRPPAAFLSMLRSTVAVAPQHESQPSAMMRQAGVTKAAKGPRPPSKKKSTRQIRREPSTVGPKRESSAQKLSRPPRGPQQRGDGDDRGDDEDGAEEPSVVLTALEQSMVRRESRDELQHAIAQRLGATAEPVRELEEYTTDHERRRLWNGLQLLVGCAVVEMNCLEYDPATRSFHHTAPLEPSHSLSVLTPSVSVAVQPLADLPPEQATANFLSSVMADPMLGASSPR